MGRPIPRISETTEHRKPADFLWSYSVNPYWKLALIFKCLTDNIVLDDFKTELQKLGDVRLKREMGGPSVTLSVSHAKPQDQIVAKEG